MKELIIKDYYDKYGKIIFEGEYRNGLKNGKGIEFQYKYGVKIFEGEYSNGKRHGKEKNIMKIMN